MKLFTIFMHMKFSQYYVYEIFTIFKYMKLFTIFMHMKFSQHYVYEIFKSI